MELNEKVNRLEDEVKIIKNEVQAVLLDIRESYLNRENPFNPEISSPTLHSVAATISGQSVGPAPESKPIKPIGNKSPVDDEPVEESEEPRDEKLVPAAGPKEQKKVATASEPEAIEEVNEAVRSEVEPEVTEMQEVQVKKNGHSRGNGKIDLVTIAGLAKWVGEAVRILGRARTETVLDFSELTGHLPPEIKNALVKFASHAPENGHIGVKSHQLVTSLIELEGLLGMDNKSDEMTLLSMVCQEVDP